MSHQKVVNLPCGVLILEYNRPSYLLHTRDPHSAQRDPLYITYYQ